MEKIEDLQLAGLKIYQDENKFKFGTDGVLLAKYAKVKKGAKVLDIGTGTGIVTFIMYGLQPQAEYTGIDIQDEMISMAMRSKEFNKIENIGFEHIDLKEFNGKKEFDVIVCNPPYEKNNTGEQNKNPYEAMSRYEITTSLEEIIKCVSRSLASNGKFFMIHKAERLAEIIKIMYDNGLELKAICPILNGKKEIPRLLLMEGTSNGKEYLHWQVPLILQGENE